MEDNFRVRVDKAFGSLAPSQASSLSSLWSLTDEEIARKEWNRDKDSPQPERARPAPFRGDNLFEEERESNTRSQFQEDLDELEGNDLLDEEDEPSSNRSRKPEDHNEEEWDIRSSVGKDCTLDFEEEEDEYDKVAVEEKPEDRLYMNDVNDYETEADDWNELPESIKEVGRDPRANHIAAKLRLEEDAEAAKQMGSLCVSEGENGVSFAEETGNLKPILKRKDDQQNQLDLKQQKRVRFSYDCKDNIDEADKDMAMETSSTGREEGHKPPLEQPSNVPDYLRNPAKYTRYTFESSEMSDETNEQAYMDFLNIIRGRRGEKEMEEGPMELPKSVPFIPKKKPGDVMLCSQSTELKKDHGDGASKDMANKRSLPTIIAAGDDDGCPMEEDELDMGAGEQRSAAKSCRQYRTKAKGETGEG